MMQQCDVDFIITLRKYADRLQGFRLFFIDEMESHAAPAPAAQGHAAPDSLAYVLYTSGSTGTPKGVCVEHCNVCHYVRAFQHEFHPSQQDIMLQYSVCSFDIFVEEVFTTLLSGAALAIPSDETRQNLPTLAAFMESNGVTMVSGFPYLLLEMNQQQQIPASIRLLISGGDVLRKGYVTNLLGQAEIYNTYGPSETTVCATYFRCTENNALPDGTYPIGKAVLGTSILLLDEEMQPVKPGEVGEICIMGGGVSRGYIGQDDKNGAFCRGPGGRLYRSGDLAYALPDGNLAFLHRKDTQVMIWGKRVEPSEVEDVLCRCREVKEGLVEAHTDEQSLSYLTAYIVPRSKVISLASIKTQMRQYLPPFMIPAFFVLLDQMPMTANGKPNRAALPVVLKEESFDGCNG